MYIQYRGRLFFVFHLNVQWPLILATLILKPRYREVYYREVHHCYVWLWIECQWAMSIQYFKFEAHQYLNLMYLSCQNGEWPSSIFCCASKARCAVRYWTIEKGFLSKSKQRFLEGRTYCICSAREFIQYGRINFWQMHGNMHISI